MKSCKYFTDTSPICRNDKYSQDAHCDFIYSKYIKVHIIRSDVLIEDISMTLRFFLVLLSETLFSPS